MHKGAVWLSRSNNKKRLRRASKSLNSGDLLELNYNAELLHQVVPEPQLVHDAQHYSIWYKPYGLYCQGSRWGDFASINRWVETHLNKLQNNNARPVFLVHRLDRATTGLILLCHSKTAATKLLQNSVACSKIERSVNGTKALSKGIVLTFPMTLKSTPLSRTNLLIPYFRASLIIHVIRYWTLSYSAAGNTR